MTPKPQANILDKILNLDVETSKLGRGFKLKQKQQIQALITEAELRAVAVFEKEHAYELDKISDRLHEKANAQLKLKGGE